ncbi:hypothetical protein VO63_33905 [Streptomyces showdoensis]|uniref:Uncharacterized protein n=1 Tax=Streptomyces showdoensis TaxID=68268 RepID=A0A2P2GF81_STREW|nr:hypothetical protein VO63_33905 [Streptomyces showdoensis]
MRPVPARTAPEPVRRPFVRAVPLPRKRRPDDAPAGGAAPGTPAAPAPVAVTPVRLPLPEPAPAAEPERTPQAPAAPAVAPVPPGHPAPSHPRRTEEPQP